ncbi:TetR family transcriptional regulator [Pseudonocardia autotrophica]|uniref:HTH-type transcriptional repressor KstR2 n=3 Tax=Pseudonocardiaceae TaxID=2070 RepID=A0A1Y2MS16_PSEAH|nr:HTH-type transcriptional repressor KstR2 [Pseudonocardia autotrophica]TDN74592.1 TetR family transcriptional regulator [Pseudonocardia autotrophica]
MTMADTAAVTVETRSGRRPRDRRAHIIAAAAHRFYLDGYHRVSMAEIAADVGIGPSALYRHFSSKESMLLTVLDVLLAEMEALDGDLITELAGFVLKHREFGVLWQREVGHLPVENQRTLRHRVRGLAKRVGAGIDDAADLRSWATLSVLDSPTYHHTDLDDRSVVDILTTAVDAVSTVALPDDQSVVDDGSVGLQPASRREALLMIACRLFAERGYPSVGLIDIGAAAGIAGASVYNHFASKPEVLATALHRGNEALWLGLHEALAHAASATDALDRLVTHYANFSVRNPHIIAILVTQTLHLPPEYSGGLHRAQRDYVAEWVALVLSSRPDLTEAEAAVTVHAAFCLMNSLCRIHALRSLPGHITNTACLAKAVLGLSR